MSDPTERRIRANEWGEWECACGNVPGSSGFHPFPDADDDEAPIFVCDQCGILIEAATPRIIGTTGTRTDRAPRPEGV